MVGTKRKCLVGCERSPACRTCLSAWCAGATQDFFAKWGDEGVVDLQEQLTDLIIITASRTLLGTQSSISRQRLGRVTAAEKIYARPL